MVHASTKLPGVRRPQRPRLGRGRAARPEGEFIVGQVQLG
jgi:hypothetical protein